MHRTRPDRRSLLLAGGTGLAVFAAPGWIRGAFSPEEPGSNAPEALRAALERATALGKPLMVIVVPADDLCLERGRLWGDLFAFAPEAAMADFALCEWVCAPAADLVRANPAAKTARETVAVLVETAEAPVRTRSVVFRLGDLQPRKMGGFPTEEMRERARELALLLQKAILPDAETLERRQAQSETSPAPGAGDLPLTLEGDVRLRLRAVDRHAALLRAQAESAPNRRARNLAALAQAASLRLWDAEPAGAEWKTEHVDPCPPCGMAHIDGASRAFLEFYVAKGPGRGAR